MVYNTTPLSASCNQYNKQHQLHCSDREANHMGVNLPPLNDHCELGLLRRNDHRRLGAIHRGSQQEWMQKILGEISSWGRAHSQILLQLGVAMTFLVVMIDNILNINWTSTIIYTSVCSLCSESSLSFWFVSCSTWMSVPSSSCRMFRVQETLLDISLSPSWFPSVSEISVFFRCLPSLSSGKDRGRRWHNIIRKT